MANEFKGVLLCSDLDGTLALGRTIPDQNIEALQRFMKQGGHFCVSTGRTAEYLLSFPRLPYNAPFICGNGTEIFDPKTMQTVYRVPLPPSYKAAVRYALENCEGISQILFYPTVDLSSQDALHVSENRIGEKSIIYSPASTDSLDAVLSDTPMLKVVLTFDENKQACSACKASLEAAFPQYYFNRSWHFGLEIVSLSTNKGVCARRLKEMLGDDVLVCVGDFENDKPMLDAADLSFTPENGWDVLKETANAVLCHCKDGALAELVERLPAFLAQVRAGKA